MLRLYDVQMSERNELSSRIEGGFANAALNGSTPGRHLYTSKRASFDSIDPNGTDFGRAHLRIYAHLSERSRSVLGPSHVPRVSFADCRGSDSLKEARQDGSEHLGVARNRRRSTIGDTHWLGRVSQRSLNLLVLCGQSMTAATPF